MIRAINDKIKELKTKTDDNSLGLFGEATIFRMGFYRYNERFLAKLNKELPELSRFYEQGYKLKQKALDNK